MDNQPSFYAAQPSGYDDGGTLESYHLTERVAANSADAALSASTQIPAGASSVRVWGQILTTFAGNAISSLTLGDSGDADRWGVAGALTVGTFVTLKKADLTDTSSATTILVTGDQIATSGAILLHITYKLPRRSVTFA